MHRIPHTKRLPLPCRAWYSIENGGIKTSMKKLLFIIPSVLLLLAAGTLIFCKHHAERSGLACMDIDL